MRTRRLNKVKHYEILEKAYESMGNLGSYYEPFTVPQIISMAERGVSGEESYWIPDASVLAATSPGMEDFEDLSSWIQNQKCSNRSDRCLGLNLSQFQLHT